MMHQDESDASGSKPRVLTIALYEDVLDACEAIQALAKAGFYAEQISVMARDQESDQGDQADRHTTLAQAIVATGFRPVANQLAGLIVTIVPERGTFLVSSDIARVLVAVGQREHGEEASRPGDFLQQVLQEIGLSAQEASYIDARLSNGSVLVGLADVEGDGLDRAGSILADSDAVHLGRGQATLAPFDDRPQTPLPPDAGFNGDVVVSDGLAQFVQLCAVGATAGPWAALCGARVSDQQGKEVGEIVELFAEPTNGDPDAAHHLRYALLRHGGMLGLMQRLTALPIEMIQIDGDEVRVLSSYDVIDNAVPFDPDLPLSRHEEAVVCAYFGVTPYWASDGAESESGERAGG